MQTISNITRTLGVFINTMSIIVILVVGAYILLFGKMESLSISHDEVMRKLNSEMRIDKLRSIAAHDDDYIRKLEVFVLKSNEAAVGICGGLLLFNALNILLLLQRNKPTTN